MHPNQPVQIEIALPETEAALRPHVLLVEDDADVRAAIAEFLHRFGCSVHAASSGRDALLHLSGNTPVAMIITDLVMPEMDGIETILWLRERRPEIPVIAMSGGGRRVRAEPLLDAAQRLGASRILMKPFTSECLLEAVFGTLGTDPAQPYRLEVPFISTHCLPVGHCGATTNQG